MCPWDQAPQLCIVIGCDFLCGLGLLQKEVSLMCGEDYIICGCKDNCLD